MDMNEYCLHAMMKERIEEMRVAAWVAALRSASRGPRRPVRVVVGHWLVRLGTRLLDGFTPARAAA
ncbi:MAG TPA: hypothetical protein VMQ51_03690 [Candidatus Binatia bacterium]|nr:hypothetical protein [Candidatus Binatia bacterium]